jgi:hypothetical protein
MILWGKHRLKMIGWKKVCIRGEECRRYYHFVAEAAAAAEYHVLKLGIPTDAIVSETAPKIRASKALVIDYINISRYYPQSELPKTIFRDSFESLYTGLFIYTVGQIVEVPDFDMRLNVQCSTGIHFYKTKEEAINYY